MTDKIKNNYCPSPAGSPDVEMEPDARLVAEGWQLRFVSDEERVTEMVDLYSAIGYDTHVEPAPPLCTGCAIALACRHKVIYTRRR